MNEELNELIPFILNSQTSKSLLKGFGSFLKGKEQSTGEDSDLLDLTSTKKLNTLHYLFINAIAQQNAIPIEQVLSDLEHSFYLDLNLGNVSIGEFSFPSEMETPIPTAEPLLRKEIINESALDSFKQELLSKLVEYKDLPDDKIKNLLSRLKKE